MTIDKYGAYILNLCFGNRIWSHYVKDVILLMPKLYGFDWPLFVSEEVTPLTPELYLGEQYVLGVSVSWDVSSVATLLEGFPIKGALWSFQPPLVVWF